MLTKIQGDLKIMSLPDVLQWIKLARKSGSLVFERGMEKKVIFFRKGVIIGANSNHPKDKVGEVLIRMGLLKSEDIEAGLVEQKKTSELIGDIFLARGLITTKEFVSALERQATEIIYDLFSWKGGEFIFQERLPKERTIPIEIKIDFVLMEGMRRIDEWRRINEAFPTLDIVLDWSEDKPAGDKSAPGAALLDLIDGKNTILDICDRSPLNDFETCNLLYTLQLGKKIGKICVRGATEVMEDDDVQRLLSRGRSFYQERKFGEAIPFFERALKLKPENQEAERFLTRAVTEVQNELLQSFQSPSAVLEIDSRFRFEEARELAAAEGFVLSRIDGKSTAKEIIYASVLSQTETCATLTRLLEKGIIKAGKDKESREITGRRSMERENLDPTWKTLELDLTEASLSEILLDLIKQRQTGVLQLLQASMDVRVYFQAGALIFATSNMECDRCGSILLRKGKITEAQYEEVKRLSEEEDMLEGNALLKLGILSPNDLIWLTMTTVEEILVSLFGWKEGTARFFETDPGGFDIIQLKLTPGRIFLEGTRRHFEETEILEVFRSPEAIPIRAESPSLSGSELDLSETEAAVFDVVDGKNRIEEIASLTGMEPPEVLKILFGFYSLGLVRICGEAGVDREVEKEEGEEKEGDGVLQEMTEKWGEVQRQNYYRILDVQPEVSNRKIKKKFFRFSQQYRPDKCVRYTDQRILDLMLNIFLTGKEAHDVLTDPEQREKYDLYLKEHGEETSASDYQQQVRPNVEGGPILKAEDHFNKAKGMLFSGRADEALRLLEQALELVPDDPDYIAYTGLAWARLKKGYEETIELIEKALEANPQNADYYSFLGEAHLCYGNTQEALDAFNGALEINPRHIQAKREVRRLTSEN